MYNFQIYQKTLGCVLVRKTTLVFAWHVDTVCMIIHVKYSRWGINSIKVYSKGVSNEKMYCSVFIHKIQYHITIKSELFLPKYNNLKWLIHYKMIRLRSKNYFMELTQHNTHSTITNAAIADCAITDSDLHQSWIADLLWRTKTCYCS